MSRIVLALAVLALLPLSACFSSTHHVEESEVLVRYLPDADALLVLEVEHGIHEGGKSPDPMQAAVSALKEIASGKRIYPASGEWIASDIDAVRPEDGGSNEADRAGLAEFFKSVIVQEHGLYLESADKLSLFRLTRLEHFRRLLELANTSFNRQMRRPDEAQAPFEPEFPRFDEETWSLCRAAVANEHAWLSAHEGVVVLDVPMTGANAARCLGWIAGEGHERARAAGLDQLFQQASSLEVAAGHARMRFGEGPHEVLRFSYRSGHAESSADLIAALRNSGVALGPRTAPDKAIAAVRAPAKSK